MKQKKISRNLSIIITVFVICFSTTSFAAYKDIPKGSYYENSVNNLTQMGIVSGMDNGIFSPDTNLTRAQFVKMMTVAMGKEDQATVLQGPTIFNDVSSKYWGSGYINAGVKNGIISGYSDGAFRPEEEINFAQVVTILLRSLGYTNSNMSGVWPQNYIEKAASLGITDGIKLNADAKVSRANAAVMMDRALSTEVSGTTKTLAEQSELGTSKTFIITDTSDLDEAIPKGVIKTDIGDFIWTNIDGINYIGKKVKALVDKYNNILSIQEVIEDSKVMFVDSISDNKVEYTDARGSHSIELPDNMNFYYNGQKSLFKDIKGKVVQSSIISLATTGGNLNTYDYGILVDPIVTEPTVAAKDIVGNEKLIGNINISNIKNLTVIRNGEKSALTDIKLNDVVYLAKNPFTSNTAVLLVYDNKVTGIYEEALPNKGSVNKIVVSGKEVEVAAVEAANKLNDSENAFKIDSEITVLTGINGKAVDVISPNSINLYNTAIVINARQGNLSLINKINDDTDITSSQKLVYYVKLYRADGTVKEYQTDVDQAQQIGKLVRFNTNDDGLTVLENINYSKVSGTVDKYERKLGDHWFSDDAKILNMNYTYGQAGDVEVFQVKISDLPTNITEDRIIDVQYGGPFDDIKLLVLNKMFGTNKYGIVLAKKTSSGSNNNTVNTFTIMTDGRTVQYTDSTHNYPANIGDVVYFEANSNTLTELRILFPLQKSTVIQGVDSRRVKINNTIYKLSDNIEVYDIKEGTPKKVSIYDLPKEDVKYTAVYNDLDSYKGIRIMTFIKE